jgi:hypothetical protein
VEDGETVAKRHLVLALAEHLGARRAGSSRTGSSPRARRADDAQRPFVPVSQSGAPSAV